MLNLPVFITLCIIAVAASLYAVPRLVRYSARAQGMLSYPLSELSTTIRVVLLSLGACAVGAYMAPRAGLATPLLDSMLQFNSPHIIFFNQLVPMIASTLQVLLGLVLLQVLFVRHNLSTEHRVPAPLGARLLAEGVLEEIVYRWGLMSVVVQILNRELGLDPSGAMVGGIVVAAVASSLAHVSDLSRLKFDCLSKAVASVLVLHFWAALCYGWLFWQYGLTTAMLCHIMVVFVVLKARDLGGFLFSLDESDARV